MISQALKPYENVANIKIERVFSPEEANIKVGMFSDPSLNEDGWSPYFSGNLMINLKGKDVPESLQAGTNICHSFLHEFGHALGLSHPTRYGETGSKDPLPDEYASYRYSVMTYNGYPFLQDEQGNGLRWESRYPTTLMPFDLITLNELYGLRNHVKTGVDVYTVGTSTGITIYDTDGKDTLSAQGSDNRAWIDLRPGHYSSINTGDLQIGNVFIWKDSQIENAIGGDKDDVLMGNDLANTLRGGKGNDKLIGGAGKDHLLGGENDDVLDGVDGEGGDLLEGGSGFDTYYVDAGDKVQDTDGRGAVYFNGVLVGGKEEKGKKGTFKGADGLIYKLQGNTLYVVNPNGELSRASKDASGAQGGMLIIEGFDKEQNDLGIQLEELEDEPPEEIKKAAKMRYDPLILDLNGDGVTTTTLANGTHFDFAGDGFAEKTAWIDHNDAFLVRDKNGNGQIDHAAELFSDLTPLKNGKTAANGFEALRDLDENGDGKLDAQDAAWNSLKLWQDKNGNGKVDEGELFSLADKGLLALNTGYTHTNHTDAQGQTHAEQGSFVYENGSTGKMEDLIFTTDTYHAKQTNYLDIDEAIRALPQIDGRGQIKSLWQSLATEKAAGENTLQTLIAQFANETDLTKRREIAITLIYHWTGSANTAAGSRGYYIDARQMQTLEQMMGSPFVGVEGTRNPNSNAAAELKKAFENFATSVYEQLMQQTWLKEYYSKISYTWDSASETLKADLSGVKEKLLTKMTSDLKGAIWDAIDLIRFLDMKVIGFDIGEFVNQAISEHPIDAATQKYFADNGIWLGGSGNDQIKLSQTTRMVFAGDGDDVIYSDNVLNKTLYGGTGDDKITAYYGDQLLDGGEGNDYLYSNSSGKAQLLGGAGNDTIYFSHYGNSTIDGGDGNDVISTLGTWGAWGDRKNVIAGGKGNDDITSDSAADTYIFNRGDGQDTITDESLSWYTNYGWGVAGEDTLQFGEGITKEDLHFSRQGDDLLIKISDPNNPEATDRIVVKNWNSWAYKIEHFTFTDGSSLSMTEVNNLSMIGSNKADTLRLWSDAGIASAGAGNDLLVGTERAEFLAGGQGDDVITTGAGNDVLAFNKGDGLDTLNANWYGGGKTISLGGGLDYADLSLQKSGNDLILNTGTNEGMVLKDWYASSAYQNIVTLQVIAEAMQDFKVGGSNPLLDNKIERFDFAALVKDFDAARNVSASESVNASPTLDAWSLTHKLLDRHLAGSNDAALGGDLAYQYGMTGSLSTIGASSAQELAGAANFGSQLQSLRPQNTQQEGARLA